MRHIMFFPHCLKKFSEENKVQKEQPVPLLKETAVLCQQVSETLTLVNYQLEV